LKGTEAGGLKKKKKKKKKPAPFFKEGQRSKEGKAGGRKLPGVSQKQVIRKKGKTVPLMTVPQKKSEKKEREVGRNSYKKTSRRPGMFKSGETLPIPEGGAL